MVSIPTFLCETGHPAEPASAGFREENQLGASEDAFHRKVPFLDVRSFDFASRPWMPARTTILGPAVVTNAFNHLSMCWRPTTPRIFTADFFVSFFPSVLANIWRTRPSQKLGSVTVLLRERNSHLNRARPYDFCNCHSITTHGHARERIILALGEGVLLPSSPRAASLRLLCGRCEPLAADRFRRPDPPSWGGENDMRVEEPSEGCTERPEVTLSRGSFGAGVETSSRFRR